MLSAVRLQAVDTDKYSCVSTHVYMSFAIQKAKPCQHGNTMS